MNVHTAADNFAVVQTGKQAVEALIECIHDTWEHKGLAGVVVLCSNFADTAYNALLLEANPAAQKNMADEVNALALSLKKAVSKSNAKFKASKK